MSMGYQQSPTHLPMYGVVTLWTEKDEELGGEAPLVVSHTQWVQADLGGGNTGRKIAARDELTRIFLQNILGFMLD